MKIYEEDWSCKNCGYDDYKSQKDGDKCERCGQIHTVAERDMSKRPE